MIPPRPPLPGQPVLSFARRLLEYVISTRVVAGPGIYLRQSAGGTVISTTPGTSSPAAQKPVPLAILASRPPYIAEPPGTPASGTKRYFIEWGTLNNLVADNWNAHFDVAATTYFFAKATLRTTGSLLVQNWEIVTGPDYDSHETPDWEIGAPRPNSVVVSLGMVVVADEQHTVSQSGGGSLVVSEHVTSIQPGSGAGEIRIGKELTYHRLAY